MKREKEKENYRERQKLWKQKDRKNLKGSKEERKETRKNNWMNKYLKEREREKKDGQEERKR